MTEKLHEKGLYRVSFSKSYDKIRRNLHFILVEPESPGNIGAMARAMKTCGFQNLILVNPKEKNHPETKWIGPFYFRSPQIESSYQASGLHAAGHPGYHA